MSTTELPLSIPFAKIRAAMESLGIPVDDLISVDFHANEVRVEQYRGKWAGTASTVVTTIPYERDAP